VLIKSVLFSFPIYQFSSCWLLWELKNLAQAIKKFLWQGGKSNTKRFHLENWNLVRSPKDHGGLGVRDIELVNIALGSKLLWRMVTGKNEWWKKALLKKYFSGERRRCLDNPPSRQVGSPIWKLLWASLPLMQHSLYWVPGNGKLINIWKDGILGSHPLCQDPSFDTLRNGCGLNISMCYLISLNGILMVIGRVGIWEIFPPTLAISPKPSSCS
jgi:hypothetical protein